MTARTVEKYRLDGDTLPTIPTPHDCVIKTVSFDDEYLVFEFEDNIAVHDSVQYIHPSARSLVMRFHLVDPEFYAYKHIYSKTREGFYLIDNSELSPVGNDKHALEYISHTVGFLSIMIKLYRQGEILLDLSVDCVELEWIE